MSAAQESRPAVLTDAGRRYVERWAHVVPYLLRILPIPSSVDRDDLESIGYEALCRAAARWRRGGGATERTYAIHYCRWAIISAIRVAPGGSRSRPSAVSFWEPVGGEFDDLVLADILAGPGEEALFREVQRRALYDGIAALPDRMRTVVVSRLQGDQFREIARQLGVSDSRAKQIEDQAIDRLRGALQRAGAVACTIKPRKKKSPGDASSRGQ